jgi:hypothetical protein
MIAIADTSVEALDRAEAAARLLDVEVEPVDGARPSAIAAAGDRAAAPAGSAAGHAAHETTAAAAAPAETASHAGAPSVPPPTPHPGGATR